MNLDRYEKIDGWQALEHLKNNELVTREIDGYTLQTKLIGGLLFEKEPAEEDFDICDIVLNELIESNWYIKKPFDVRQAMRERPNEWVGKYKKIGDWWEVGFDESHFNVIAKRLDRHLPVDTTLAGITFPGPEELDACIPIEDVHEEETR